MRKPFYYYEHVKLPQPSAAEREAKLQQDIYQFLKRGNKITIIPPVQIGSHQHEIPHVTLGGRRIWVRI